MPHIPVLAAPAIEALAIRPSGIYVDATFGAGGHAALILARLGAAGRLVAFDADPSAGAYAPADPRFTLIHANFRALAVELDALGIGRGALDAALSYSKERRQFGKAISEFQAIQFKLATMATELDAESDRTIAVDDACEQQPRP